MKRRSALIALAGAQFVMVLDQTVMGVSISQLVADFDTTVTTIQAIITLYCLVMAMLMLAGGKIGDIIGRRRAFKIGLVIYGCGSAMTALAPTVAILTLGWSILEGIGASLVLPAMVALIAGNFEGKDRKVAYAVIGGVAGAGIAVGPILGGWATTVLSWRVVFAGEVVLVIGIFVMTRFVADALRSGPKPRLDIVGAVLSATGLGLIVLGTLQSSVWGLIEPKDAPIEPFGLAPTLFVIAAGGVLLWAFVGWQRHREAIGSDPLVHLDLLKILPLRSGLIGLFTQNLLLMGVFFTVPLYLQLVLGLDALQTGLKMLPVSVAMFAASAAGSRLSTRYSVRSITRTGLILSGIACVMLLATIKPDLADLAFAASMAVLGAGMGLMASQLGLVVQSSVDASGRGEAGGLQFTGQQLGSSLGVALIGAIVLAGLTTTFVSTIQADPRISQAVAGQVGTAVGSGIDFVSSASVEAAAQKAGLDAAETAAIVDDYEQAQLKSLKAGSTRSRAPRPHLASVHRGPAREGAGERCQHPTTVPPPRTGPPSDGLAGVGCPRQVAFVATPRLRARHSVSVGVIRHGGCAGRRRRAYSGVIPNWVATQRAIRSPIGTGRGSCSDSWSWGSLPTRRPRMRRQRVSTDGRDRKPPPRCSIRIRSRRWVSSYSTRTANSRPRSSALEAWGQVPGSGSCWPCSPRSAWPWGSSAAGSLARCTIGACSPPRTTRSVSVASCRGARLLSG